MDFTNNSYDYANPYCADPYQVEFAQFAPSTQQAQYGHTYSTEYQPYSQQHSSFDHQPHFNMYQLPPPPHQQYECHPIVYEESCRPIWPQETEQFASVSEPRIYQQPPNDHYQPVSSLSLDGSKISGGISSTHSSLVEAVYHSSQYQSSCVSREQNNQSFEKRSSQPHQSQALISYAPLGSKSCGPTIPVRKPRSHNNKSKKPEESRTKKAGGKTVFSEFQLDVLQQRFSLGMSVSRLESITLAKNLNLTETQVSNWFANRKKRSLPVECSSTGDDWSEYWTPRTDGEKSSISLNDLTKAQIEELHKKFSEDHRLTGLERKEFAEKIGANEKTVELWFARQRKIFKNQNRMRLLEQHSV
ncbi:hypothetical protein CAEBREN_04988 [Caenorhabditis brenneri]|uniref:Homeobox domain-containing protein n=1 Tax=Caenorhabditis brenneri TaxID=135651 RepID=G0NF54_CAEBE|nr:hypothetical protein CAEBREN_04988 [Caenorhabditis brenneri]